MCGIHTKRGKAPSSDVEERQREFGLEYSSVSNEQTDVCRAGPAGGRQRVATELPHLTFKGENLPERNTCYVMRKTGGEDGLFPSCLSCSLSENL